MKRIETVRLYPSRRQAAAHKEAAKIVCDYGTIVLEDLRVKNMTRSAKGTLDAPGRNVRAKAGLNRAILDAGFGLIRQLIAILFRAELRPAPRRVGKPNVDDARSALSRGSTPFTRYDAA